MPHTQLAFHFRAISVRTGIATDATKMQKFLIISDLSAQRGEGKFGSGILSRRLVSFRI
jgi:hypothetical protein